MANQVTNYKCPACTGPMHFAGASGKLECDYCGSSFTVEEVEAMYANEDANAAQAKTDADKREEDIRNSDEWEYVQEQWVEEGMKAYSCPSCGAELVCDDTTAATCCPYCGNTTIVPGQVSGMLKPEYIVPFKLEKNKAIEKLKAHYQGKVLLPKSFKDGNHIEEISGVYVPFWLYDGTASGSASYNAEKRHTKTVGDERIKTTEHYRVHRAGHVSFTKIPADASSKMPDDIMDSIEPYDYKDLKSFSNAYMAGYLADKYDVSAEDNASRIKERAKNTLDKLLRDSVKGYDSVSETGSNINIEQGKVTYAMMPVWMLTTKWEGKNYMFAMNGQTGKFVGNLPMDKGKFFGIFFAVLVLLEILMAVVTSGSAMTFTSLLISFGLIPFGVALIVGAVLRGQLKSVAIASSAFDYIDEKGFKLIRNTDTYSHTTETRERINNNK